VIAIVAPESPIAVLAQTLALALALASPGGRPAVEPLPDNAARARRGLLPRKVVKARPPARGGRRIVLLPQAPTWLGEPGEIAAPAAGEVIEVAPGVIAEPALASMAEPALTAVVEPALAAAPRVEAVETVAAVVPAPDEAPPEVRAAVEGAEVGWVLVRRLEEPEDPALQATVSEPELQVLLVRRPPAP
jgi:hypothetical protein